MFARPGLQKLPNIVIICSDQHRAAAMGAYGNDVCRTRFLDRLAEQGSRFDRCYAQNPVCMPQRASLLTGCTSRNHGVRVNGIPLPRAVPTLADLLQAQGYRTAAVGKLHLSNQCDGVPEAPYYGFQRLESLEDSKVGPYLDWALHEFPEYEGYLVGTLFNLPTVEHYWRERRDFRRECLPARDRYVKPLEISDRCNWGFGHYSPLPPEAHQNSWIADRAIACMEAASASQPLFLWAGFVDPHNPFDPPTAYRQLYPPECVDPRIYHPGEEAGWTMHHRALQAYFANFHESDWQILRALYYASVTFMDEQIGRILAAAESRLDMENTIVVYLSDHGEILGDHGICGKCAYHFDSCIRVPLLARWDGHWEPGNAVSEIIESTDLTPTLLHAAGIEANVVMDGKSFLPLLHGEQEYHHRGHAYIESFSGGPEDPTPAPLTWARTIRSDRWRATFYPGNSRGELYDLRDDPHEVMNLWDNPMCHEVIEEHRRILLDRLILQDYPVRGRVGTV